MTTNDSGEPIQCILVYEEKDTISSYATALMIQMTVTRLRHMVLTRAMMNCLTVSVVRSS